MPIPTEDHVSRLVAALVDERGYDLEGVDVTSTGGRAAIRVVVDCDDGVDLDSVAELSRALSAQLDAVEEQSAGPYTLEVTTPGVDRPLTRERHWRRARGRRAEVMVAGTSILGRVGAIYGTAGRDDGAADTVDLVVSGKAGPTVRSIALSEVERAVVQVEFAPPDPRELALTQQAHSNVETAGVNEE